MTRLPDLEIDAFLSQAEYIAQLVTHPAWTAWTGLLTAMRQAALEQLALCSDPGEFRYWQGVAGALGEMLDRPQRIVAAADEIRTAEEADKKGIRLDLRAAIGLGADHDGDI